VNIAYFQYLFSVILQKLGRGFLLAGAVRMDGYLYQWPALLYDESIIR